MTADRCQRWRHGRGAWRHPADGGFDPAGYRVVPIPQSAARPFVLAHHYAAAYPAGRLTYGLVSDRPHAGAELEVDGGLLVGVAVLSVPMQARVLTSVFPDLEPYRESLELGRFVLLDDVAANGESWFLARVHRLAAADGIRGLVSFCDPVPRRRDVPGIDPATGEAVVLRETITPGHVGIVYQAANAVPIGRSTPRTLTYLPRHGVVLSDRTLQKLRAGERGADGAERTLVGYGARPRPAGVPAGVWLRQALADVGAVRVRHPGCWRYAWPLGGPAARRRICIAPARTARPKPDGGIVDQLDLWTGAA